MCGSRGMSLRKVTSLGSNLVSVTDFSNGKRIETPYSLCCDFGGCKLVGQVAQFEFESKFEPLPVTWQSLRMLFQKVINGQALRAALRLCLRGSDGRAQTQGVSESAAVAAGRDRLALRKTCYQSCDTESVQESTRFQCFINFGQQRLGVTFFAKQQVRIDDLSEERASAQRLQMATRKSLETMSGVILNQLQPKFAAKTVANEMRCLKAMH